jgi:beta-carotene 3-hydroxylase
VDHWRAREERGVWTWIPVAVLVAMVMEPWAALLHGRLWHGPMWGLHRSHHEPKRGWELNDALSAAHAPVAIVLIVYGCEAAPGALREVAFGVGVGMTAFGLAYLVVHDGFVHQRLPVAFLGRWKYFRRVASAHGVHHRTGGAPNGLFAGPWVVRALARGQKAKRALARPLLKSPSPIKGDEVRPASRTESVA